jgi:ABC-type Fe3+/spermidine/putrescine transport system ATPase subunit
MSLEILNGTYLHDIKSVKGVYDINLKLNKNTFYSVLGKSGSGKSTLLKLVSQKLKPQKGEVKSQFQCYLVDFQKNYLDDRTFNQYLKQLDESKIEKARELVEFFDLSDVLNSKSMELSTGQYFRFILVFSLMQEMDFLVIDDMFESLDPMTKKEISKELFSYCQQNKLGMIFSCHDLEFAQNFSHQCILINGGKIEQIGSYQNLAMQPINIFVAQFFGPNNILPLETRKLSANLNFNPTNLAENYQEYEFIFFNAQNILFNSQGEFRGKVSKVILKNYFQLIQVQYFEYSLWGMALSTDNIQAGSKINFDIRWENIHLMEKRG